MTIKDKVVIITGASSGIGEATAKLLAEKGAKLVLAARRKEKLKKIVEEITENSGMAVYQVTDVTKREDNQALIDFAKTAYWASGCHFSKCRNHAELTTICSEGR